MARKKGSGTPIDIRLMNKIKVNEITDCWEWQGGTNNIGYGMIRDVHGMRTTHRVSYEIYKGMIPHNMLVLHNCDNPKCCNPNHLRLGTHKDNTHDMIRRGRTNFFGVQDLKPCRVCGAMASPAMLARWHNDKCKHVPNSINTTSTKSTSACA